MQVEVTFRNLKPREEVRRRAQALFEKLQRFLDPSAEAHVVVQSEHGKLITELVVNTRGETYVASEEDDELRTAMDRMFHKMETNLRRGKGKRQERRRRSTEHEDGFGDPIGPGDDPD